MARDCDLLLTYKNNDNYKKCTIKLLSKLSLPFLKLVLKSVLVIYVYFFLKININLNKISFLHQFFYKKLKDKSYLNTMPSLPKRHYYKIEKKKINKIKLFYGLPQKLL